jgi:hypothetical protein
VDVYPLSPVFCPRSFRSPLNFFWQPRPCAPVARRPRSLGKTQQTTGHLPVVPRTNENSPPYKHKSYPFSCCKPITVIDPCVPLFSPCAPPPRRRSPLVRLPRAASPSQLLLVFQPARLKSRPIWARCACLGVIRVGASSWGGWWPVGARASVDFLRVTWPRKKKEESRNP